MRTFTAASLIAELSTSGIVAHVVAGRVVVRDVHDDDVVVVMDDDTRYDADGALVFAVDTTDVLITALDGGDVQFAVDGVVDGDGSFGEKVAVAIVDTLEDADHDVPRHAHGSGVCTYCTPATAR